MVWKPVVLFSKSLGFVFHSSLDLGALFLYILVTYSEQGWDKVEESETQLTEAPNLRGHTHPKALSHQNK